MRVMRPLTNLGTSSGTYLLEEPAVTVRQLVSMSCVMSTKRISQYPSVPQRSADRVYLVASRAGCLTHHYWETHGAK